MYGSLDSVSSVSRPTAYPDLAVTRSSRLLPVQPSTLRKVSLICPPDVRSRPQQKIGLTRHIRAVRHPAAGEACVDIAGHYDDLGLHYDVRQSGAEVVVRHYGISHAGVLRDNVLTVPTLADSQGTVLHNGHIKFFGGAHWIKHDMAPAPGPVPSTPERLLDYSHPEASSPISSDVSKRGFNSWPGACRAGGLAAPACALGADIAGVLWARETPAARARLTCLGNALERAAAEAADEGTSRGGSSPARSANSSIASLPASPAGRLASLRPSSLTADADAPASDKGFPATLLSIDTPQYADQALAKSEALLQQITDLLEEAPSAAVGQNSQSPSSLQVRSRRGSLGESTTPIAGRALRRSESLLSELLELDTFAEEDGEESFGSNQGL